MDGADRRLRPCPRLRRLSWLDPSELRVGLGCMRLSPARFAETVAAAVEAGITVFDTARAYGESERLLADALAGAGGARIVTKGGMRETWIPDGRAKTILTDCEASLRALSGLPIDTYLIHAPDPRTPWATTVRALARLVDEGMVARVGVSNVNRRQLDEALALAPIAAVEVALSVLDDRAVRGGVLERCADAGIALIAHSPLGGPRRAGGLARREELAEAARAQDVTPAEIALARLLALAPVVVAIPGATRPETARSAAHAARLMIPAAVQTPAPRPRRAPPRTNGEVLLVMGIPGAGKTRLARDFAARGYTRLNRDERGGGLRLLAEALDAELADGTRHVVLDNTYLTRASRSYVLESASAHGVPVRCLWLSTPLAQAQVNLVQRLLDHFGHLPMPDELRGRTEGVLSPTSQMRTFRELEPPAEDEGFVAIEIVPFVRAPGDGRPGVFVAAAALAADSAFESPEPGAPHLVFDWRPGATDDVLDPLVARLHGDATGAVCPHPGGPPSCWCRPPLPGLPLAFARAHGVDPAKSILVGTGPAHRNLAAALGAGYVAAA